MESRALVILLAVLLVACSSGGGGSTPSPMPPSSTDYTVFGNPELITIIGYNGDSMEPFVSRDGVYLFFNSSGANKDIFYAAFINATSVQYQGPIASINTAAVEGTPTADTASRFFYVTTANYDPPTAYDTIYSGTWNGSSVTGAAAVSGLAKTTPGFVNFDIEVSPDGNSLYFADGDFSGGNAFPDSADIAIAVMSGNAFIRDPNSSVILANVNTTTHLEYAPAISADALELFFTRVDLSTSQVRIYRSTRASA